MAYLTNDVTILTNDVTMTPGARKTGLWRRAAGNSATGCDRHRATLSSPR
jgi:hypothetical protein